MVARAFWHPSEEKAMPWRNTVHGERGAGPSQLAVGTINAREGLYPFFTGTVKKATLLSSIETCGWVIGGLPSQGMPSWDWPGCGKQCSNQGVFHGESEGSVWPAPHFSVTKFLMVARHSLLKGHWGIFGPALVVSRGLAIGSSQCCLR